MIKKYWGIISVEGDFFDANEAIFRLVFFDELRHGDLAVDGGHIVWISHGNRVSRKYD